MGTARKKIVHVQLVPNATEFFFRKTKFGYNENEQRRTVIVASFVGFKFWDMAQLKSKYSKIIFRFIVQWQRKGETPVYKNLKNIFGLPDACQPFAIMARYINPACEEVSKLLGSPVIAVPLYDRKHGRMLTGVYFKFEPYIYKTYETEVMEFVRANEDEFFDEDVERYSKENIF
ncbi:MAG: replication initiation protein [Lachnospiraceae bacterium]|nr:replication initiation protein [Lachnospiraceae bacterium]